MHIELNLCWMVYVSITFKKIIVVDGQKGCFTSWSNEILIEQKSLVLLKF